jgi:hypothetical protein
MFGEVRPYPVEEVDHHTLAVGGGIPDLDQVVYRMHPVLHSAHKAVELA